jgi:Calcineurin-like phosphoesterase
MTNGTLEVVAPSLSTSDQVRMVVISDIHATMHKKVSTLVARSTAGEPGNALSDLRSYLKDEIQSADLLVCPGDLVHRGKTRPMKWVWSELHEIAQVLGAELIGTAGNHDLLLKPKGADRPEKGLRGLSPKFPHGDTNCVDTYWAHDFGVVQGSKWRILCINSSSYLGGFDHKEAKHGRFGPDCEQGLRERLGEADTGCAINVCVFHHHPQEWTVDSDAPTSHMLEGDKLIKMLEERPEAWMVVHGHKHFSRLDYIGHSNGGPVRLASGSLGANLLEVSGTKVRNQVHVVEFDLGMAAELGLRMAGHVHSYDWASKGGWGPAVEGPGLPTRSSFGYRRDGFELASWLARTAREGGKRSWTWAELLDLEPRINFLADCDLNEFFNAVQQLDGGVQEGLREVTLP